MTDAQTWQTLVGIGVLMLLAGGAFFISWLADGNTLIPPDKPGRHRALKRWADR